MSAGEPIRRASDALFDEILDSRDSRRQSNIRTIKQICDLMEKDRVKISAAEVTRRGGPAYSTICNKGSQLGEYVKLRITEQLAGRPTVASTPENLSDTISDPVLAAKIRDHESTARWLRRENAALRHFLKSLKPGVDIDSALSQASKGQPLTFQQHPPAATAVGNELRKVLLKLMDHLIGDRQYAEVRGRLTVNHKVILDPAELVVYREACGLLVEAWNQRYGGC